jgi:hypothetical protein
MWKIHSKALVSFWAIGGTYIHRHTYIHAFSHTFMLHL